jgi:FkbM family methyltransferase
MAKKFILNMAAAAARLLPVAVKRRIYQQPALARFIRGGLNKAVPSGLVPVEIAAGGLKGYRMVLDLQMEKDYWLGTYEPDLQSAIRAWVKPGMVAYDVGANIGYITLLFARTVGENGKVICFEALPQNVERLNANLLENNLEPRVRVEQCAVVDHLGPVGFLVGPSNGTGKAAGSTGRKNVIYAQSISVEGVSLDHYVYDQGNPPPDVIKMDIEGGEILALPGMARLISDIRPLIFLELHGSKAARSAWEALTSNQYQIHSMQPGYPEVESCEQLEWKSYLMAKPKS